MSGDIYRVVGCPGAGKTTYLAAEAKRHANHYGAANVILVSLTKTAAAEIGGRDTGIPDENVATLHGHARRAIEAHDGKAPVLAETAAMLKAFGEQYPEYAGEAGGDGEDRIHGLHEAVAARRARMTPIDQWTEAEQLYHSSWHLFKLQRGATDYADWITRCLNEGDDGIPPAGLPRVMLLDEAQDFSRLELALAVQWARSLDVTVIAADSLQALFTWRGSDPDALDAIDYAGVKVLDQSYRCPVAVRDLAVEWASQIPGGAQGWQARPTIFGDDSGNSRVDQAPFSLRDVDDVLDEATICHDYDTTMVLASCRYMLAPLCAELKARGVPYHNPWRCSPPDEPILTNRGWVPISELDPQKDLLAGFYAPNNALSWGGKSGPRLPTDRPRGFPFSISYRAYKGPMLTISTATSSTRVTPNHRMRLRFKPNFLDKHVVYLMRRGSWWRVGVCGSGTAPFKNGGVRNRLATEEADAAWILDVFETRREALIAEAVLQSEWGLSGAIFPTGRLPRHPNGSYLRPEDLQLLHDLLVPRSGERATRLLHSRGLLVGHPLYERDGIYRQQSTKAFETVAANLIPEYMEIPTIPEVFVSTDCNRIAPIWRDFEVEQQKFTGRVYSMDVPEIEHYVSGGAVVHNSEEAAWNPLAGKGAAALRALLRPVADCHGAEARMWTWGDLQIIIAPMLGKWLGTGMRELVDARCLVDRFGETRRDQAVTPRDIYDLVIDHHTDGADLLLGIAADRHATRDAVGWWRDNLTAAGAKQAAYALEVLEQYGAQALTATPRLTVGTIHSTKGSEADHVILSPDLSKEAYWQHWVAGDTDATVRMFYVGITRARERLTILEPSATEYAPVGDMLRHGVR